MFEFLLDVAYDWENIPSYEHLVIGEKVEDDILDIIIDELPDLTPAEFEFAQVCLADGAIVDYNAAPGERWLAIEDRTLDDAAEVLLLSAQLGLMAYSGLGGVTPSGGKGVMRIINKALF
ncbi:MAG: hypothetical protein [Circular genetic element sp.]|nr:MAG: hypothetical protein [Circular genetic element sp.]